MSLNIPPTRLSPDDGRARLVLMNKHQIIHPNAQVSVRSSEAHYSHAVVQSVSRADAIAKAEAQVHASRFELPKHQAAAAAKLAALRASDSPELFVVLSWHSHIAAAAKAASARFAHVVEVEVAS